MGEGGREKKNEEIPPSTPAHAYQSLCFILVFNTMPCTWDISLVATNVPGMMYAFVLYAV